MSSINLAEFVTEDRKFNYADFGRTVQIAVEALNDVLDAGLPLHPLKEQRDSVRDWRQIGLGIMGLADMLIKMEIKYGSKEAIDLCNKIGSKMAREAILESLQLAKIMEPFPKYNKEKIMESEFFKAHISPVTESYMETYNIGLRNSQLLTIAPTGSLSTMLGISGGIEPVYANYYTRKTESLHGHEEYYKVYTPIVKKYMEKHGLTDDSQLPDFFVTAQNLNYKERIDMQAVWQTHIDASISSTVNVPNSFTVEDTENLYMYAWEKGLKGITIFRDGCKRTGILTTDNSKSGSSEASIEAENPQELKRGMIIKADDNCIGKKRTLQTGCGTLHCEAFFDQETGDLLETYLSKGSSGGCLNTLCGLSRMISLSARGGIDVYSIVDQLKSSGTCPSYAVRTATKHDTSRGSSCPVAVGNALIGMYEELQGEIFEGKEEKPKKKPVRGKRAEINPIDEAKIVPCPECGAPLVFEGGCNTCKECGFSKCD